MKEIHSGGSMQRYYFDYNATTPIAPEVIEELTPVLRDDFGNASSIHQFGQAARQRMETARGRAAGMLKCAPREIVFASGGTEADNLAIFGAVRASAKPRKHVITTAIEHPAVLKSCAQLEREGVEVTYLTVGSSGVVDPAAVRGALRPETVLVSVMHANNELGTLQPLTKISAIVREAGVLLHSDGVQAAGKVAVDVDVLGVDLYSVSGHKIYAPKGIGALYVRKGTRLAPMLHGGRHEDGLRAGTENVPGAVAFGKAAEWVTERLAEESLRVRELRNRLERGILSRVPRTNVNGHSKRRTPNTSNIRFDGIEGEAMVIALDLMGFAVSSGAACSSGAVEPSHVLLAIGLSAPEARSSIRFSLGRLNTVAQVDALVDAVAEAALKLRRISPAYAHA